MRTGTLGAYLQLLRPANVVTAWADVLAGAAVAGITVSFTDGTSFPPVTAVGGLLAATTGLYGGGIVLNDVFDAALDAEERPERPIPSGRASRRSAALFGGTLLLAGVVAAAVGPASGLLAGGIAAMAVLYDAVVGDHVVLGPLTMGLCRGGNLLLGVSIAPGSMASAWYLGLLPVAYVAAITAVSRGEVRGGTARTGVLAVALVTVVAGTLGALAVRGDYWGFHAAPFALLFAGRVLPPFVRAARTPEPDPIRAAVQAGVTGLIPLNAALAAGFGGGLYGLGVLALWPLSLGLARVFDVT